MMSKFIDKWSGKILAVFLAVMMALTGIGLTAFGTLRVSANISDTLDPERKYRADYESFGKTEEAAAELNLELAAEGSVLLKNKDSALPLTVVEGSNTKVTVLGSQADTLSTGGGGSGAQSKPGGAETPATAATIFQSLNAVNIEYNPSVKQKYEDPKLDPKKLSNGNPHDGGHYMTKINEATGDCIEFDGGQYVSVTDGTGSLDGVDLSGYNDTALVVISRTGAEGNDNLAYDLPNMEEKSDHYLQLDKSEKELMAYAKKNFDKIVVILNSPAAMELGCLEDDDGIDAVLWIGQPGWNGIMSLGKILTGAVNPSGRTVDFYMRDFATDPTWYNLGSYSQSNAIVNGDRVCEGLRSGSTPKMGYDPLYATEGITDGNYTVLDYAEGVYVGYKYYETVYEDLKKEAGKEKADEWYSKAAVYPFGYGLSYTTFTQKIKDVKGDLSDKNGEIVVTVTVTNTGSKAGKEVVQLYSTPSYEEQGIEKAAVNIVGFAKTKMLEPKALQDVEIKIAVKDLASFDYNDANGNKNFGYELEKGKYVLSIRRNSHEILDSKTLEASALQTWDEDGNPDTPNNIFSQKGNAWEMYNTLAHDWTADNVNDYGDHYLRRHQLIIGTGASAEVALEEEYENGAPNDMQKRLAWLIADGGVNNKFRKETFVAMNTQSSERAYEDYDNHLTNEVETDYKNLWVKSETDIPADWTQGAGKKDEYGMYSIELSDMTGIPLDDEKWTKFINQLSWAELVQIVGDGGYGSKAVESIGKPHLRDHDGPGQIRAEAGGAQEGNGYAWVCESVIGSTWNVALAYEQGRIVGNESIFLNVNGWYGPAMNIHRSALSGRNFEYYSQDGIHGGYMLAAVVYGATEKGMHVYMKHAFLNDQETGRMGTATWATEQAIREIYAKPFEIAIKKGNANGIMTSFNRIGTATSAGYGIAYHLYTNEWGYDGISVTDAYVTSTGWDSEVMIRGAVLPLNSIFPIFPPASAIEGKWDTALRGGKGGVTVDKTAGSTEQVYSPTQWYWARTTATRALFTFANGNAVTGFSPRMMLSDKSCVLAPNNTYAGGTAIGVYSSAELDKFYADMINVYDSADKYEVRVDGLPDGMKLDMKTGVLTGKTPAIPGKYEVSVTVLGKGNFSPIADTAIFTLNIAAPMEYNKDIAATSFTNTGFVVLTEGEGGNYVPGGEVISDNVNKYIDVKYSASGLPEGLSVDADTGNITGKLTKLPEYFGMDMEFELTQTLTFCEHPLFGKLGTKTEVYTGTMYISVSGGTNVSYNVNIPGYGSKEIARGGDKIGDLGSPGAPVKGFEFLGWAASADAKEVLDNAADIPETLHAIWQWPPVTIINGTFWVNGEDTGISPEGQTGETGVGIADVTFVNGEKDTTVTVKLTDGTEKTFTVPNGAAGAAGGNGSTGPAGQDGKDASAALGTASLVISIVAAAGVAVLIVLTAIKRKKNAD